MNVLLSVLSVTLLGLLIFRFFRETKKGFRPRAFLFLFLLLYSALIYQTLRWTETPQDILALVLGLTACGLFAFAADSLGRVLAGRRRLANHLKQLKKSQGPLAELAAAANLLAQSKTGALIVIERRQPLEAWHKKGILVDALLNKEILFSIFTPPGDLHDGAAFISHDRVAAAGIIVPLTSAANFRKDLGTRHRAAMGMCEATDALCLVISEETGAVSLADRGVLYYGIPLEYLPQYLADGMRFRLKKSARGKRAAPRETAGQVSLLSSTA